MSKTKGIPNIWVAFAGAVLAGTVALPQAVTAQDVTYAGDVAAILEENCVRCHRAGTAAPMVLDTYEQVRAFAPLIKHSVQTRTMPPGWYIDRTVGIQDFKNDPSLSVAGDRDDRQLGRLGYAGWATWRSCRQRG